MSKKILILGGSVNQLPAINAAIKLGVETHVVDNIPENPGHKIASSSHNIDTTDIDAICRLVKQEQYDGILSPCTDVAVLTAATVAEKFALSGVPVNAARVLTSKISFRNFQKQEGFPYPYFHEIKNKKTINLEQSWDGLVVKPDKSSGSKGISILDNQSFFKIGSAVDLAVENSLNSKAHIEQVILGHHGTLEGVVVDEKLSRTFFLDRQIVDWKTPRTIGHKYPSTLNENFKEELLMQINSIFSKLKIKNAIFDVDFVVSDDDQRVYIIEMSPRLGGNSISELIQFSTSVNLPEIAVSMAVSDQLPIYHHTRDLDVGVALLGSEMTGKLVINSQLLSQLAERKDILKVNLNIKNGDAVSAFSTGRDVIASVVFCADSQLSLSELEFEIRTKKLFTVLKGV